MRNFIALSPQIQRKLANRSRPLGEVIGRGKIGENRIVKRARMIIADRSKQSGEKAMIAGHS